MELVIEKCFIVSYHRPKNPVIYNYSMNSFLISRRKEAYGLGVTLDEGLNFNVRIVDKSLSKAFKLLCFIIRQTRACNYPLYLKSLFTGLVRTCVEFYFVVWVPHCVSAINRVERIQRKFTRLALKMLSLEGS